MKVKLNENYCKKTLTIELNPNPVSLISTMLGIDKNSILEVT